MKCQQQSICITVQWLVGKCSCVFLLLAFSHSICDTFQITCAIHQLGSSIALESEKVRVYLLHLFLLLLFLDIFKAFVIKIAFTMELWYCAAIYTSTSSSSSTRHLQNTKKIVVRNQNLESFFIRMKV